MSDTDMRLVISTYEALQGQVDEHSAEIAAIQLTMAKLLALLTANLEELKAQGKYP